MEENKVILENKTFILGKAPATVAYDIALKLNTVKETADTDLLSKCFYILARYIKLDLGDGRQVAVSRDILDQHLTEFKSVLTLQQEVIKVNFGFFPNAAS